MSKGVVAYQNVMCAECGWIFDIQAKGGRVIATHPTSDIQRLGGLPCPNEGKTYQVPLTDCEEL